MVALMLLTAPLLRARRVAADRVLIAAAWMLCALSAVIVARVARDVLSRQLLWIVLGWGVFIVTVQIPDLLERLRRYKYTWLCASLLVVVLTLIVGQDLNGSGVRLW